jgi:hypothetical protein
LDALVGWFDAIGWTAVALIVAIVVIVFITAGGRWK